ncbi:MAG: flagellar basal body rod protein FlgB [Acidobacteriota bacterium]|nr:flagellar basal body rod protein FlgB [Acidobacteriota bacterium]
MGQISDASIMAALRQQMTQAVARETVAASNIANVDTPGYKAREIDFSQLLDGQLGALPMAETRAGHLAGPVPADAGTVVTPGLPERRDGNTVQVDHELVNMTQANIDFSAAQTVLAEKFRLVRYAINGQ